MTLFKNGVQEFVFLWSSVKLLQRGCENSNLFERKR